MSGRKGRRWLAPEVLQTSLTDCGPAALKCLLDGFGRPVSYGRLREACQTGVDGTSVNTLEQLGVQLGLDIEQVMLPSEFLTLPALRPLPAMVVVLHSTGAHVSVVWSGWGPWLQMMDPAAGRMVVRCERLLQQIFTHTMALPTESVQGWLASDEFLRPLALRLRHLRCENQLSQLLQVTQDEARGWCHAARLDAAVRLVTELCDSGAVPRGAPAAAYLQRLAEVEQPFDVSLVPARYWYVQPPPAPNDAPESVSIRGMILLRADRGLRSAEAGADAVAAPTGIDSSLFEAISKPAAPPWRLAFKMLGRTGARRAGIVGAGLLLTAGITVLEALLLRVTLQLASDISSPARRWAGLAALASFAAIALGFDTFAARHVSRLGAHLELGLRLAFLRKMPRIPDRYFSSRPVSDMVGRGHNLHRVRTAPWLAYRLMRALTLMLACAAAIAWVSPAYGWLAWALVAVSAAWPLLAMPWLAELSMRQQTHTGALTTFYLDALTGQLPVRSHDAVATMRQTHRERLLDWGRATSRFARVALFMTTGQAGLTLGLSMLLIWRQSLLQHPETLLLLFYWTQSLRQFSQDASEALLEYPALRAFLLRWNEPLTTPEHNPGQSAPWPVQPESAQVVLRDVQVLACGLPVLQDVSLQLDPGAHVAVVGGSGAGKSTFLGLLLGWYQAAQGEVLVDQVRLDGDNVALLRPQVAWVDPSVRLTQASLLDNLLYGLREVDPGLLQQVLAETGLEQLAASLPQGLQTPLGEGGTRLSGGEGQRVRLARALLRREARLVLYDEPFRGLDAPTRHALLNHSRAWWRGKTLLCVLHDMQDALSFPRVLVMAQGQVQEDGDPAVLARDPNSQFARLLAAEQDNLTALGGRWRHLHLLEGRLHERS